VSANPERWHLLETLYQAALEQPAGQRAQYLRENCPDESLRREVESLLGYSPEGDPLLRNSPWAAGEALTARASIGPYVIEERIGAGGMGEVYRARDPKLNRPVAVKLLSDRIADPAARRRFQREAQMASSLNHPHILTVYDAGEFEGRQYLVTEYVDGGTLRQWTAPSRTWRHAVDLLAGVADGLAAAHAANILHRDIKPENILLTRSGYAKLADFGLAKLAERRSATGVDETETVGTRPGMVLGTPAYMSPEQAAGAALDARSDIFSFGVVLYEALSSVRPFRAASDVDLLHAIIHDAPGTLPASVPPGLRAIVEKAMEKDASDRYQSMRELVIDLRRLVRPSSGTAIPAAAPVQAPVRRWLLSTAALAFAVGAAVIAFAWRSSLQEKAHFPRHTPFAVSRDIHYFPSWSPDGAAVAYTAETAGDRQLFLRYLDAPVARQMTHASGTGYWSAWSADSKRIYFVRATSTGADVMSVGVFGGEPEKVMVLTDSASGLRVPALSPDGKTLAVMGREPDGTPEIRTSSPLGAPFRKYSPIPFEMRLLRDGPGLSFSPDGKWILYIVDSTTRQIGLLPWPPASGAPRRILTSLTGLGGTPQHSWYPDSRHLVLAAQMDRADPPHLWMASIDSGRLEPLTGGAGSQMMPSVSPDGKRILYAEVKRSMDVVSLSLADAAATRLIATDRYERMPAWSANRPHLTYLSDRNGPPEIWMRDAEGNDKPLVSHAAFPPGTTDDFLNPALSPDATRVVFGRVDTSKAIRLWISSVTGGPPVRLTNTTSDTQEVPGAWSPDGSRFAFLEVARGTNTIRIVKTTGEAPPTSIPTVDSSSPYLPDWSPAGEWITFHDSRQGWRLVAPDGSRGKLLGDLPSPFLAFSKDGRRLYGVRTDASRSALFALDIGATQLRTIGEISRESAPGQYAVPVSLSRFSVSPDGKSLTYGTRIYRNSLYILEGFPQPSRFPWFRLPWPN
jgi:eukaryotic-like serine/threonine-protein kinase